MRRKREKGYWVKRVESFTSGSEAKQRASHLRTHEHVEHVVVKATREGYNVYYSVAKFYLDDLKRAGIEL